MRLALAALVALATLAPSAGAEPPTTVYAAGAGLYARDSAVSGACESPAEIVVSYDRDAGSGTLHYGAPACLEVHNALVLGFGAYACEEGAGAISCARDGGTYWESFRLGPDGAFRYDRGNTLGSWFRVEGLLARTP